MNKLPLCLVVFLFTLCVGCSPETEQERAGKSALAFCESFYNLNYPLAANYVTSSSLPLLQYYASNIRQEHLDAVRQSGIATVSLIHTELEENAQEGRVVCRIQNVLEADFINGTFSFIEEIRDTLTVQQTEGTWQVRMDNLRRSGK
ncbi:MAG: hypothetical protein LIP08_15795 [Bacteroides sp.]|nr:hypothetical protein [Bacteroides sp.]